VVATTELLSPMEVARLTLGDQLDDAGWRIGLLLMAMGVLHAVTLAAMPVLALIVNSTRAGRAVPRWIWVLLVIAAWELSSLPFLFAGLTFGSD
jgi:hypothetical protein